MKNLLAFLSIIALTISFGMVTSTAYEENRAISLDGDGDYVICQGSASLDVADQITIEAWIKPGVYPSAIAEYHDGSTYGPHLWIHTTINLFVNFVDSGGNHHILASDANSLTLGEWQHVVATYDGSVGILFVNGVVVKSENLGTFTLRTDRSLYIGHRPGNGFYSGLIDDARIWNIARTESEILATMDKSLTGNEPGLVGYWKFDEESGNTASDSTPNGNDGTLQGDADFVESDAPISDVSSDPEIWLSTDNLIFCKTVIGEYDELPVTIMNIGQDDLEVTDILSDNANFTASPTTFTLPYLESEEILVTFTPTAEAVETGTLTIISNVPDEDISLTGEGASFINRAVIFDGDGDYVEFIKDIPETNLTVEFWFRTTSANGGMFAVRDNIPGRGGHDRHVYLDNGYLKQRVWNNEVITSTNSGFNDGGWHHYAMIIEQGVGQKMYVDGQLEASGGKDRSDFTNQNRFSIGYSNDKGWFNGQIDDVRVWNVARTQGDIAVYKNIVLTGGEPGLIGYWHLDDCERFRTAQDSTPYNVYGVLVNNAAFVEADTPLSPIPEEATIAIFPPALDFGSVAVGEYSELVFDVLNIGQEILLVTDIVSDDDQLFVSPQPFPHVTGAEEVSFNVAYGEKQPIRVRYTPAGDTQLDTKLTISSNDPNSPIVEIPVTGNGVEYNNRAVSLDGNGDYVEVPYVSAMRPDEWTMEIWVKLNFIDGNRRGIMGGGWNSNDFYIGTRDNKFYAWIYGASGGNGVHSTFQPNLDQWYHLVASYDAQTLRLYVDGELQDSVVHAWRKDTLPFYFGRTVGGEYSNAILDEARFWNFARTQAEIQATKDILMTGKASGLVGYWRFDEKPGSNIAMDLTQSGNNGALYRNAVFVPSEAPIEQPSVSPNIVVSKSSINFGDVVLETSVERTLILFNSGQNDLQVTDIRSTDSAFLASPRTSVLSFGERREILVKFIPKTEGVVTANLAIHSNDPDSPVDIDLRGNGISYINRAVRFDGSGDMISISHNVNFNLNNVTVELWMKPNSNLAGKSVSFLRKEGSSQTPLILEQLYNNSNSGTEELFMWVNNGSSWDKNTRAAYNKVAFSPGMWHHLAGTYDGSTIKLYWNGQLISERRYTGGAGSNASPLYIGSSGSDRWFDGLIDEVRIFNYARTQAEIVATNDIILTGDEPGLVGYWRFDDAPGSQKAMDSSGNNNAGTLSGNAEFVNSSAPTQLPSEDADITVFPSVLEFGSVVLGNNVEKNLIIINRGKSILEVNNIQSDDANVTVSLVSFPLLPGEKMEVPTQFTPTAEGDFSANFTISSNDPDSDSVVVPVKGVAIAVSPTPNQAIWFDGSGDYVEVADSDSLDLTDNFTFESWVFVNASGYRAIFEKQGSYVWSVINGTVHWALMTEGRWEWHNTGVTIEYNQWTHLVLTYVSPNVQIYKNGILSSTLSDPQGGDLDTTDDILRIGGRNNGEWFSGNLDEVRIWNVVRTEDGIRENMYVSLAGDETGLAGYWEFNDPKDSTTATDSSPNGNDGTLQGNAAIVDSDLPLPPTRGDVDRNGLITAYDALRILQASLGFIELSAIEFYAADVSGNWDASAYDASLVLQYDVGKIEEFPAAPAEWLLENVVVSLSKSIFSSSGRVKIPVAINDMAGVLSCELVLIYDSNRLKLVDVFAPLTDSSAKYHLAHRAEDGELRISLATAEPTSGSGKIVEVEFETLQISNRDLSSSVQLVKAILNEYAHTKLENTVPIPSKTVLLSNYPNPFNPETWIPYLLADDAPVTINIYNAKGQLVRIIDLGIRKAGSYVTKDKAVMWNGRNQFGERVSSRIYFYFLQAGDFKATRKMVIMK